MMLSSQGRHHQRRSYSIAERIRGDATMETKLVCLNKHN